MITEDVVRKFNNQDVADIVKGVTLGMAAYLTIIADSGGVAHTSEVDDAFEEMKNTMHIIRQTYPQVI